MVDIFEALKQQTKVIETTEQNDFMKLEVFECHLYRMGYDSRYYRDIDPCDREEFLSKLEKQNV